jgi:hypothetical protein
LTIPCGAVLMVRQLLQPQRSLQDRDALSVTPSPNGT